MYTYTTHINLYKCANYVCFFFYYVPTFLYSTDIALFLIFEHIKHTFMCKTLHLLLFLTGPSFCHVHTTYTLTSFKLLLKRHTGEHLSYRPSSEIAPVPSQSLYHELKEQPQASTDVRERFSQCQLLSKECKAIL